MPVVPRLSLAIVQRMSNAAGVRASREEEIAFLVMETVLGVDIHLADAGAGNQKPDGAWVSRDAKGRRGIVEITSPPDKELLKKWHKPREMASHSQKAARFH